MSKGKRIVQGMFASFTGLLCLISATLHAYIRHEVEWMIMNLVLGSLLVITGTIMLMCAAERKS